MTSAFCFLKSKFNEVVRGPARRAQQLVFVSVCVLALWLVAAALMPSLRWIAVYWTLGCIAVILLLLVIMVARLSGKINEVLSSISLYLNLMNARALPTPLFVDGAAASPNMQLLLYKCLALLKPKSILELGSGQSTRVLAEYCRVYPDVHAITLESDENWYHKLKEELTHTCGTYDYRYKPLTPVEIVVGVRNLHVSTNWYQIGEELEDLRFQIVVVDGPTSQRQYSRAGVLSQLPKILATTFVIVFDDAERLGEQMTIRECERTLQHAGVRHHAFEVCGVKTQFILCSPDVAFLQSV